MADFFLGESTQNGFKTFFGTQILKKDCYTYILKGGAGTGKSTLMKKIAEVFEDSDDVDRYFCASDTSSLDAVVLNKRKVIVVDGTSPHTFDPYYPGVNQSIINLGEFWDTQKLRANADDIVRTTDENQECHKRCRRYLSALASINTDIYSIASGALKQEKLSGYIGRFAKKNLPDKKKAVGISEYRQFSAVTTDGYTVHPTYADYVYMLSDENYAGADFFLRKIEEIATERGYDVIIGECGLFSTPVYEHLIIQELSIGFFTSNRMNECYDKFDAKINFSRFYSEEKIRAKKGRLDFSKKAAKELMNECSKTLRNAKAIHDELEKYYISAVNFIEIDEMSKDIILKIKGIMS